METFNCCPGGKFKFRFLFIKLTRDLHIVVCLFFYIVIICEKENICVREFLSELPLVYLLQLVVIMMVLYLECVCCLCLNI